MNIGCYIAYKIQYNYWITAAAVVVVIVFILLSGLSPVMFCGLIAVVPFRGTKKGEEYEETTTNSLFKPVRFYAHRAS